MTTLRHIIFVDLLPIVIIVALFLVYRRMELRKWKFKLKNAENDADFWFNKAGIFEKEMVKFVNEFQALSKEIRKGNAKPYHPDLERLERLKSAVSKEDIESGGDYTYRVPFDHNAEWDASILRNAEEQRDPGYVPGQPFQPPMPWTPEEWQNAEALRNSMANKILSHLKRCRYVSSQEADVNTKGLSCAFDFIANDRTDEELMKHALIMCNEIPWSMEIEDFCGTCFDMATGIGFRGGFNLVAIPAQNLPDE